MNEVNLKINKPDAYDMALHSDYIRVLQDYGDLEIITKDGGMESGRACALLTFTVDVDGKKCRAQTVVPVRLLLMAYRALSAAYSDDGRPYQT